MGRSAGDLIIGGPLVRVLAVRELELLLEDRDDAVGDDVASGEPACDARVVTGRVREGASGQLTPGCLGDFASIAQLAEYERVVIRAGDRGDVGEVLCSPAQHCRAADVDHLDAGLPVERVEVHDDEVERLDLVLLQRGDVVVAVAARKDRRMDARVERFNAAAEHLRHLGQGLDMRALDAVLLQEGSRSSAGDDGDVELGEPAREVGEPGLVVNRDQRSHRSRTTFGSNACSTVWTRARSVSTVSSGRTGTRSAAITGPESIPSST